MILSRSLSGFLTLGIALLGGIFPAHSQGQSQISPAPPSAANEARQRLQLVLVQASCELPLALKAQSLTAGEIAALVQKNLATYDKEPVKSLRVQVRQVLPVRLSFQAKKSTVGGVLRSTAALAGAKLWVLPHLLLLAPESALSAEELYLAKARTLISTPTIADHPFLSPEAATLFISFIKNEIAALAGNSATGDSKKVTFDQLSPDAQTMLRQLVQDVNHSFEQVSRNITPFQSLVLSPEIGVETTSMEKRGLNLSIPESEGPENTMFIKGLGWDDKGMHDTKLGIGSRPRKVSPPPLTDPSAGNS